MDFFVVTGSIGAAHTRCVGKPFEPVTAEKTAAIWVRAG